METKNEQLILQFVALQKKLVTSFRLSHPHVKDTKWLLDFPKHGSIIVNNDRWDFIKHGAGLRFRRASCSPQLVVDVHTAFDNPEVVDEWRLQQYVESLKS